MLALNAKLCHIFLVLFQEGLGLERQSISRR